jgi:hypothetical protein
MDGTSSEDLAAFGIGHSGWKLGPQVFLNNVNLSHFTEEQNLKCDGSLACSVFHIPFLGHSTTNLCKMTGVLCDICNAQPKKYKCPTCSIP